MRRIRRRRGPVLSLVRIAARRDSREPSASSRRWCSPTSSGSTELASSLDPEELRGRLAPFFEVARSALEEHGGTVEKYIGDAVMAVFGVPRAHGDDPDRAVAAALDLSRRVESLGRELSRSGRGGDGRGARRAARWRPLGHRRGGERRRSAADRRRSRARCWSASAPRAPAGPRARGASAGRGEGLPGAACGLDRGGRGWSGTPHAAGTAPRPRSSGRDDDLALLELVYRRATRDRVPELVTITGEAGVGKTRLATELFEALRSAEPAPPDPPRPQPAVRPRHRASGRSARSCDARRRPAPTTPSAEVHEALAQRLAGLGADDADELAATLATALGGAATRRRHRGRAEARLAPAGGPAGRRAPAGDRDRRRPLGRRRPARPDRGGRLQARRRPAAGASARAGRSCSSAGRTSAGRLAT